MIELTVYEDHSKISQTVQKNSGTVHLLPTFANNIFVLDANGKNVHFKYHSELENSFGVISGNKVVVVKNGNTMEGTLIENTENKIIFTENHGRIVTVRNPDIVEIVPSNHQDHIQFLDEENHPYPYKIHYFTNKIYWKCNGFGFISKEKDSIYKMNIYFKAQIYNDTPFKDFNITLASKNYENIHMHMSNRSMSKKSDRKYEMDSFDEDGEFLYHLGQKKLEHGMNLYDYENQEWEAKKMFFHQFGSDITTFGFVIKTIESIPNCEIIFYKKDMSRPVSNELEKSYGTIQFPQTYRFTNYKLIFYPTSLMRVISSVTSTPSKDTLSLNIEESPDESSQLILSHYTGNKIILSNTCREQYISLSKTTQHAKYQPRISPNHIEFLLSLEPKQKVTKICDLTYEV